MADRPHQIQVRPQHRYDGGFKSRQNGPSPSKVLVLLALLPVGGTLLCLAGITLAGTLIGLALITPLFLICSPVVVPAAIVIGMSVAGFITSGAFGVTGLSWLSWVLNYLRGVGASVPQQMEEAKRRMQDVAAQMGEKTKEVGEAIQKKAQEGGK